MNLECGDQAPLPAARPRALIGNGDEGEFFVKSGAWSPHSKEATPCVQGYDEKVP